MIRRSRVNPRMVLQCALAGVALGVPAVVCAQAPAETTCATMLTQEEAAAIVGDSYAGPAVDEPRPGFTRCEWQGNDSNFSVTYANAQSLKEDSTTADATFEMDVSVVETDERKRELLPGIGQKAAIVSLGDDAMLLEVARADGVARVVLYKVARDKAVLLARAIAEP